VIENLIADPNRSKTPMNAQMRNCDVHSTMLIPSKETVEKKKADRNQGTNPKKIRKVPIIADLF
jgi:hypothetical protein